MGFEPLGAFGRALTNREAHQSLQHLILAINGTDARTQEDIQELLDGYVRKTHGRVPTLHTINPGFSPGPILGIKVLIVKKPRVASDWVDSTFTFGASDYSMLWSGFSISAITLPTITQCPCSFSAAMKSTYCGEWLAALFAHLDNCHSIGTYGPPCLPPSDVTILPAVIVLKHVINSNKQINERKVSCLCVNGSFQQKGIDCTESFAPTILAISIKVFIAISLHLQCDIYHIDISNAFQNTPAPPDANGRHLSLWVFPEYLLWYQARFPNEHKQLQALLKQTSKNSKYLGIEMFAHVQGRRDASREWGQHIDQVTFDKLKLLPNRADTALCLSRTH